MNMDKKVWVIIVGVGVVMGAAGFFGGMKYGQTPKALASMSQSDKMKLLSSMRGTFTGAPGQGGSGNVTFGGRGTGGFGGRAGGGQGAGFTAGEIISKDDKSITVKAQDGGSKIIFYSTSTPIGKAMQGSASDLTVGENVTVAGSANSDGSVTAQSIQIRPAMTTQAPQNPQ